MIPVQLKPARRSTSAATAATLIASAIPKVTFDSAEPEAAAESVVPKPATEAAVPEVTTESVVPKTATEAVVPEVTVEDVVPKSATEAAVPKVMAQFSYELSVTDSDGKTRVETVKREMTPEELEQSEKMMAAAFEKVKSNIESALSKVQIPTFAPIPPMVQHHWVPSIFVPTWGHSAWARWTPFAF